MLVSLAETTCSGKLFQLTTILLENENFLVLVEQCCILSFLLWPLVKVISDKLKKYLLEEDSPSFNNSYTRIMSPESSIFHRRKVKFSKAVFI